MKTPPQWKIPGGCRLAGSILSGIRWRTCRVSNSPPTSGVMTRSVGEPTFGIDTPEDYRAFAHDVPEASNSPETFCTLSLSKFIHRHSRLRSFLLPPAAWFAMSNSTRLQSEYSWS